MKTKKLVSAFVAAATFLNLVPAANLYAEETVIPESFIRTNDDADFPLHLDFDIDKNSVEYIKLDEPIYGNEFALNPDKLSFNLLVSLKEEYKNFDSFELTVARRDDNEIVFETLTNKDDTTAISNLVIEDDYSLDLKLIASEAVSGYVGVLTVIIEIDNCMVTDVFYQNSFNEGMTTTYTTPLTETEPNNNTSNANPMRNGVSMKGRISDTSDVDFFSFTTPISEEEESITLDISLSAPSTAKVILTVSTPDGRPVGTLTSSSEGKGIYMQIS